MEEQQSYGPVNSAQMISEKPHPRHNFRMIIITIVVLLLALGGYIVLSNPDIKARMQEAMMLKETPVEPNTDMQAELEQFASEITDRSLPWIEIQASETATVGQETSIQFLASSGGKDISGFDVLIALDPAQFEVVSISSASPSFQIQDFERGMYHAVTGYKNLQVTEPTVFDNTPILNMVVRPVQAGKHIVTVLGTKDKERTQLIDKDIMIYEPQVGSVYIDVN